MKDDTFTAHLSEGSEGDRTEASRFRSLQIAFTPESLKTIRDIILDKEGLDLDSYKDKCIQRRISFRIKTAGCKTVDDYVKRLQDDETEVKRLVGALTISVTEFFRNSTTFAKLRDMVIPDLFSMKRGHKVLNIWSAGCASGEEPYSIAIMLKMFFPKELEKINLSLVATDLDDRILRKAESAIYAADKIAGADPTLIDTFFIKEGGKYRLSDDIKKMVSFRRADILREEMPKGNDLIVCRNLLIYFSKEAQECILEEFWKSLNPGGFLILGRSEILVGESRRLFLTVCPKERIYRRPF